LPKDFAREKESGGEGIRPDSYREIPFRVYTLSPDHGRDQFNLATSDQLGIEYTFGFSSILFLSRA